MNQLCGGKNGISVIPLCGKCTLYSPISALFSLLTYMLCSYILENILYFPVNILACSPSYLSFLNPRENILWLKVKYKFNWFFSLLIILSQWYFCSDLQYQLWHIWNFYVCLCLPLIIFLLLQFFSMINSFPIFPYHLDINRMRKDMQ